MSAPAVVLDRQRWIELCRRLACVTCDEHFAALDAAYAELHRHYHTATHVQECLDLLDGVGQGAERRDEIELAIWLHDVVYVPWRRDNEERSAELAAAWLTECTVEDDVRDRVRGLILCTRHEEPAGTPDEALLQDIDLGIFGAPAERYAEYEAQVRREYQRVPWPIFRSRRSAILRGFLDRGTVYRTSWFLEHREAQARRNLTGALEQLRGRE